MTSRSREAGMAQGYLDFLKGHPGADLSGARERQALEGFKHYLSNLSEKTVRERTRVVYAPDAWFNDTLKTKHGAAAIEEDFLKTLKNVDEISVDFTDEVRSGNEYYLRWVMDIRYKQLNRGRVSRTIGMTHVRFNAEGQVILHQDYWDSAQGFFEYVPIIGGGIRLIKSKL
jgi:hypothetical protein